MNGKIVGCSIVAASIAFGAVMVGSSIISRNKGQISTDGIAKEKVKADFFLWDFDFELVAESKEKIDSMLKNANGKVTKMLTDAGLVEKTDFDISPRTISKTHSDKDDSYTLKQGYSVKTDKVDAGLKAYRESGELAEHGISIITEEGKRGVRCDYKQKIQLEQKLLVQALKDVEIKAQKIAKEMGWEIIGVPSFSYASLDLSNENSPEEKWSSYWDKMVNSEMLATLNVDATFEIR
jgi:hypothetical protein